MSQLPFATLRTIIKLEANSIRRILYGSQGISLYLGNFKEFGSIDLLVDDRWLHDDWQQLITVMAALGFELLDQHEHEFSDRNNHRVAFASINILARDNITRSLADALEVFKIDGHTYYTDP